MKTAALTLALLMAAVPSGHAADRKATADEDGCLMLNNRILGPRAQGRPLPLLRGDPGRGFVPACLCGDGLAPVAQERPGRQHHRAKPHHGDQRNQKDSIHVARS